MAQVRSPEQLFLHELQDMYYAEKALTKTLPQLAREASDRELESAFKSHLRETEKHVTNLERVFEHLGESPRAQRCPGIEGIKREHDEFMQQNHPPQQIKDVFLTGAAARTEHYEIAAYTGLVGQARALGEREAVDLLQQNLRQEKEALKKVESISRRIVKHAANGQRRSSKNGRRTAKR